MFAQFRSQFPMGSLLSELLQIHEGKYIVRASVQVGGATLATGLSAAHTIEQAEDQARSRALVVLGIEALQTQAVAYSPQMHFRQSDAELSQSPPQPRLSAPATQVDFLPMGDGLDEVSNEDWNLSDSTVLPFPTSEQLSWLDANPQPATSGFESRSSFDRANNSYEPKASRQRSPRPSQRETRPELAQDAAVPIDLSEVIAQTDVELKRLGWTHVQGRRYLEKTYSKRSRQHLTDAELIEFLDYLTAQPARGKTAF